MILDSDDDPGARELAESASGDVESEVINPDTSFCDDFATSELVSAPTESIGTPSAWDDFEEGRYIEDSAQSHGFHKQQNEPSTPVQIQPQVHPQFSKPVRDQVSPQGVDEMTESTLVEPALSSLTKSSNSGDDGWTDKSSAELEAELDLAWREQQRESISANTTASQNLPLPEAPQNRVQSRKQCENTDDTTEELQNASRCVTPALTLWEKESHVAKAPVVHQQDLAKIVDADDPDNEEATEILPAAQPKAFETVEYCLRLLRIRTLPVAGCQTETIQYHVEWGKHPNTSDAWFNKDDVRISRRFQPYSRDLGPVADNFQVYGIHTHLRKGRKVFEYLIDMSGLESRIWTNEDQLRISLNAVFVAESKGNYLP